jgi:hypothetical protein
MVLIKLGEGTILHFVNNHERLAKIELRLIKCVVLGGIEAKYVCELDCT